MQDVGGVGRAGRAGGAGLDKRRLVLSAAKRGATKGKPLKMVQKSPSWVRGERVGGAGLCAFSARCLRIDSRTDSANRFKNRMAESVGRIDWSRSELELT